MPEPGDFIIVHFVEFATVGMQFERKRNAWPLHITVAPWFTAPDANKLRQTLNQVATGFRPFRITVGDQADFGAHNEVPVNLVKPSTQLAALHSAVTRVLEENGAHFLKKEWVDRAYQPHITHHEERRRNNGDELPVDAMHLVRLLPPNTCEVLQRFAFAGDSA